MTHHNRALLEVNELLEQSLRLAAENLHLTLCSINGDLFNQEDRRRWQDHIDLMASLIAKHAGENLAPTVPCKKCHEFVQGKIEF